MSAVDVGSGAAVKLSIVMLTVEPVPVVENPRVVTRLLKAPETMFSESKLKFTLARESWGKAEKGALYKREFPRVSKISIPNTVVAVPANVPVSVRNDVEPATLTVDGKFPKALKLKSVPTS